MTIDHLEALQELLVNHTSVAALPWLESVLAEAKGGDRRGPFLVAFAAATVKLGKDPLRPSPEEIGRLRAAGAGSTEGGWAHDELGRAVLLLLAAQHLEGNLLGELCDDIYGHGENRERQAVLRVLPLLPQPERFLHLAVDACRNNVRPVFEAIACENSYPADHFPELNFNQMVLKALFLGLALERVVDLSRRLNPDLVRMAGDYAAERRAAGRSVPQDIERFITHTRNLT